MIRFSLRTNWRENIWLTLNGRKSAQESSSLIGCLGLSDRCTQPTCIKEGVGVSTDDHVDAADLPGDQAINVDARVTQSDDLVDPQRLQLVHDGLQGADLVQELQVRS